MDPRMPESTQLSSTSKPLHVRVPLPASSPKRHQTVRRKAPPTVASPSWTRDLNWGSGNRRLALGALVSSGLRAVRAGGRALTWGGSLNAAAAIGLPGAGAPQSSRGGGMPAPRSRSRAWREAPRVAPNLGPASAQRRQHLLSDLLNRITSVPA